jgi:hypothetical protein
MTLARFAIMLGIVLIVIGGVSFVLPGEFMYSEEIIAYLTTYGSLIIPSLKTNPSLMYFVQKAPDFIFMITGLLLILIGLIKSIK